MNLKIGFNMLKKEYEILVPFLKESWRDFTFKEVKKLSKKKSESYVYNSIKKFVNSEILEEKKAGNVILYSINLKSLKTKFIFFLILLENCPYPIQRIVSYI